MAENVVLSVQLQGAEAALAQLTQIDAVVTRLKANRNIKINVSANGLTKAATNAEKLNTSLVDVNKTAQQIGTTGAKNIDKAGTSLTKASKNAESFRLGLGNVLGTMLKFRAASMVVNFAFSAFKSAFDEMKAVDTELVNIRKVTRYSNEEINKLSKSAFSLATNYGRTASEVLEASTVFARAGYTDQIEQLSELSLLLQNVGDLNAEDASKFIIATDKAFKLGGSYKELMTIIDGLDNITNKNATDMGKLTEGMTVAGSVFAESGESVEVFAALLGTATSATQRSGSEVGRALRTILMNLRQIRGETEDGELIDGESIAAASKALKDYAGISTMENGQLRKASDVLTELAEKWDTLTDTQKAAISEAVAGKRQANILMALMGDWGSYEKMLDEYQNAAGTAAKENEIYMDSWEAKTKQVSAAWNDLISSIVQTDAIKGVLDLVISALGTIGKLVQSPVIQGALDLVNWVADLGLGLVNGVVDGIGWVIDELGKSEEDRLAEAQQAVEDAEKLAEEAEQNALEMRKSYDEDFGKGSRYEYLAQNLDKLTDAERIELGLLEGQRRERERLLELAEEEARLRAQEVEEEKEKERQQTDKVAKQKVKGLGQDIDTLTTQLEGGYIAADEYAVGLAKLIGQYQDYYNSVLDARDAGEQLTEQQLRFVEAYEALVRAYSDGGPLVEVYGKMKAIRNFAFFEEDWERSIANANVYMDAFAKTFDEIPDFKSIDIQVNAGGALGLLERIAGSVNSLRGGPITTYASGTSSARGGPALVNEKGPEMISANGLAWIAGGGKPTVTMLPKGATVLTAQQTRAATGGRGISGIPAFKDGTTSQVNDSDYVNDLERLWDKAIDYAVSGSAALDAERGYSYITASDLQGGVNLPRPEQDAAFWAAHPGLREEYEAARRAGRDATNKQRNGAGAGGASGPTPPNFKALEDELSKLLKNLDAQAKLAENEEDYLRAMMVYGSAQSAIAELLEQYRANGYADDSDEVLRLANLGYDYAAKQLGGYDKLQQNLIDALNGLTESTDKANELQERREAVDKAREALANAERQRTVRIFNPVTGQWEWVANAADVQKAQEKLQSAEEALRKEELSQAVDAIKNASAADLGNMTLSPAILEALFGGTPEQQSAFLNALGAATGGADWLSSSEAKTAWNQGNSIGTQYNLNGITLTEAQASGMTIKELIAMLQGLKIM